MYQNYINHVFLFPGMMSKTVVGVVILVILAGFVGYLAGNDFDLSDEDDEGKNDDGLEPEDNETMLLTVNSTGENNWVTQAFYLENDTGMLMDFSFFSEYETESILFESMYLINLEKDAQWEDVYVDTRVYAGDGIDQVYGHGNVGPVNESAERTGSSTSGTYSLGHIWIGFTLEAGSWYFVFESNGPHEMTFQIIFEDTIQVNERREGNGTCFAYDSRDFSGDLKGGFAGGNFNSGGSLDQAGGPWMVCTYWAEDTSIYTGATRIAFESPNGTAGARTYAGAGAGVSYDEGDFMDPLIGDDGGEWYFEIQLEVKTDIVFLCGSGVEFAMEEV